MSKERNINRIKAFIAHALNVAIIVVATIFFILGALLF